MRKQIAAANWKMNLSLEEGKDLTNDLLANSLDLTENRQVILGVPFPYLSAILDLTKDHNNVFVAAQNMASKGSGAYTGEVSAMMLKSIGISYVILGHSERREFYHEDNQNLAEKTDLALANNMVPVFCCGESLPIREANDQNEFVAKQLEDSLFHLGIESISKIIIAYEPIWAIGTGKTASSEQAQEMHAHIRAVFAGKYGQEVANEIPILYGGSVKPSNAEEIFGQADVDGGLVGGASLVAKDFAAIVNALK